MKKRWKNEEIRFYFFFNFISNLIKMELNIVYITGACDVGLCNLPSRFMSAIFLWSDDIFSLQNIKPRCVLISIFQTNSRNQRIKQKVTSFHRKHPIYVQWKTGCFYILKTYSISSIFGSNFLNYVTVKTSV